MEMISQGDSDFTLQVPEHSSLAGCSPQQGRAGRALAQGGHRVPPVGCDSGTEPLVGSPAGTSLGTRLLDVLSTECQGLGTAGGCMQVPCCSARLVCPAVWAQGVCREERPPVGSQGLSCPVLLLE